MCALIRIVLIGIGAFTVVQWAGTRRTTKVDGSGFGSKLAPAKSARTRTRKRRRSQAE